MKLRALTGLAGETMVNAGDIFEENEATAKRLIEAGYAEPVNKASDSKETATSKTAASRETRGGKKD